MELPEPQTQEPRPLPEASECIVDMIVWREFVQDLKMQWKHLWWTRIDDKVRAEGIASDEFPKLLIEKGTIIIATKDYKPPSFHEIVQMHMPAAIADQVDPSPTIGGMRKFIKEMIRKQGSSRSDPLVTQKKPKNQQQKHGGRGWLHYSLG